MKQFLIVLGLVPLCSAAASPFNFEEDTLDLSVTFVGDREVLLRDAHKEMHWPEPARIQFAKPKFEYSVLPNRLNVQPTWEKQGAQRLKIEEPLPRLYRGFAEFGMGNYLSPLLHANYTDLRSRKRTWGTAVRHESTNGGFPIEASTLSTLPPQQFSHQGLEGWYKHYAPYADLDLSTGYQRNHISYYGRVDGFNQPDTTDFPLGDSTTFHTWHTRAQLKTSEKPGRNWTVAAALDYGLLWTDRHATEHNFDTHIKLQGQVEDAPVELILHNNIDRLLRQEEGLILAPQKQAIFDVHPKVRKSFNQINTEIGFGMWVDAQGNQPFLFVPELKASVGLLQNLFVPYVAVDGGVRQNRYELALQDNPYIPAPDTGLVWRNTYERFRAKAGMRGSITSAIAFELSAQFARRDQQLFWAPTLPYGSGAAFTPIYQDISVTTLAANATWQLTDHTHIAGTVKQHTYAFPDSAYSELAAWNLPAFELQIRAQHTIKEKLKLTGQCDMLTGRRGLQAASLDNTQPGLISTTNQQLQGFSTDLEDFINIGLRVEYLYNARLSAWLNGDNLLNRANPLFAGYNSQGIRFQLGFNYAF